MLCNIKPLSQQNTHACGVRVLLAQRLYITQHSPLCRVKSTNYNSNLYKWKIRDTDICEFCKSSEKDTIIHALCRCSVTKTFLTDVFDLIDPCKVFAHKIETEDFVFGVHDSALNLMFMLAKKAIIRTRTYKQFNSPQSLYRNILRRVISDKATLSEIQFHLKWQHYYHLIYQSEQYRKAFIL